MRLTFYLTVAALAASLVPSALAQHEGRAALNSKSVVQSKLVHHVVKNRKVAWHWEDKAGLDRSPTKFMERRTPSLSFLRWMVHRWHDKAYHAMRAAKRQAVAPAGGVGHVAGWLCIHSREGAWNAATGNGYYGGLQMSYGWMGLVSNAALLSPSQQMQAAETGYRNSGYSHAWLAGQWPMTYPPCAGYF